jgi:hypothetical protein
MQKPLVRKNEASALENQKCDTGEQLFEHADRRIPGSETPDALVVMQKGFNKRCLDYQFALPLFDPVFVNPLVVGKYGVSIHRDSENRQRLAEDVGACLGSRVVFVIGHHDQPPVWLCVSLFLVPALAGINHLYSKTDATERPSRNPDSAMGLDAAARERAELRSRI